MHRSKYVIFLLFMATTAVRSHATDISTKHISLNVQNAPLREVLQILADEQQLNLVTSDSVQGDISLILNDVLWERALDTILLLKGLDRRVTENIMMVAPLGDFKAHDELLLSNAEQLEAMAPLEAAYLQVNYAKATEIAALLEHDNGGLLSEHGRVAVDDRTNTILLRDNAKHIAGVRDLVEVLDRPVKQVMIESRMVTVRDNVSKELGIRWGLSSTGESIQSSGSLTALDAIAQGELPELADRMNVNLPVANPAASLGIHVARMGDGRILDLELAALERENRGEIIASPRITTANQKPAYIEQGTEIPYVQNAISGATSVQFKKAVLGLAVTPQITPDDRIILDLKITQNTRGDTVNTPTGPAVSIDTQEISTQVLVKSGETIVLGGIFQQQILNDIAKVPFFGDIPYVGVLFRNSSKITEKRELLIFVTPRVVINDP